MTTRSGRLIKLPARFLFIAVIGILTPILRTAAHEEPTLNVTYSSDTDEKFKCFKPKTTIHHSFLVHSDYGATIHCK